MPTILFVGGGTLGHIVPAVAVAREIRRAHPDITLHFICSPRGEEKFLQRESLSCTVLDAPRIGWQFPWKFWNAYRKAKHLLREITPHVVFSKGGYVSLPVCLAARRLSIPIVLHESDAVMGRANRAIARWADTVCLGFPEQMQNAECRIQNRKINSAFCILHSKFTGNPIRPEIITGRRDEGLRITGFSGSRPVLLVMGGSQGAQSINEWVTRNLAALTTLCDVIHIAGPGKKSVLHTSPITHHYFPITFAHTELAHLYAITDLAVSRSGAGSIAELAANGIASILIPLTGVAHDHQACNAMSLHIRSAAYVVTQNSLDKQLLNVVSHLLSDSDERSRLRAAIRGCGTPAAAGQIAEILSGYLDRPVKG